MMNPLKKKILMDGIQLKIQAGQGTLDEILVLYTKLSEEEKQELRTALR